MKKEKFVGAWELQKWTAGLKDGTIVFPFDEDTIRRIYFTIMAICPLLLII